MILSAGQDSRVRTKTTTLVASKMKVNWRSPQCFLVSDALSSSTKPSPSSARWSDLWNYQQRIHGNPEFILSTTWDMRTKWCRTNLFPSCCWRRPVHWRWGSWAGLSERAPHQRHCGCQPPHRDGGNRTWPPELLRCPGSTETCKGSPPASSGPADRWGCHHPWWRTPERIKYQTYGLHPPCWRHHSMTLLALRQWITQPKD